MCRYAITAQKMKFSIKDSFGKCDQIRRKRQIWSHLLQKSLMENFTFCAVNVQGLTSGKTKCNNHYTQQLFLKQQYCKLYFDFQLRHVYIVNLLKQENVYLKRKQKGKHNLKLNNPYRSLN